MSTNIKFRKPTIHADADFILVTFPFSVNDSPKTYVVTAFMSREVYMEWGLDRVEGAKFLFREVLRRIESRMKTGSLEEEEIVLVARSTHPQESCPIDLSEIELPVEE